MPNTIRLHVNVHPGTPGLVILPAAGFERAARAITAWPGYAPTPLHDVPVFAERASVASVQIKDEASRFGLGSVKALGGTYAVAQAVAAERARRSAGVQVTVTCATGGNHGRAVAWGAQRFGADCVVFVHANVTDGRVDAIAKLGAEIRRVPGTYDDAVRAASRAAAANGWINVSDTSWPGYTAVATDIMQGYRLMPDEALTQWVGDPPTHVFVQGGVGGVAAAVSVQLRARLSPTPRLIIVEPAHAACLLMSSECKALTRLSGELDTLMAGMACGEPSMLAWAELERAAFAFTAISDAGTVNAMRLLAGRGIVAGECGAAGLAALLSASQDDRARSALQLDANSRVLLFSLEGATDPALYQRLTGRPAT